MPPAPVKLPGANRIIRRPASGGVSIQWYAWRGKGAPLLASFQGADVSAAIVAERKGAVALSKAYADALAAPTISRQAQTLGDVLRLFETENPGFKNMAQSTRRIWARILAHMRADSVIASLPVRALEREGARQVFILWRDGMQENPRKADYYMQVLNRALNWALDRELIRKNPAAGIEGIYAVDRSGAVWTPELLAPVLAAMSPACARAVRFIQLTGFRAGDAVAVTWDSVDEARGAIVWRTQKSKRRKAGKNARAVQIAALSPELLALLEECPRVAPTILTNAKGRAWTSGALSDAFATAREKAGTPKTADGLTLHLHDLRGTNATDKIAEAMAGQEFKNSMGWSNDSSIAGVYVDAERVLDAVAQKRNARGKPATETATDAKDALDDGEKDE